jgi:signal peptidase I
MDQRLPRRGQGVAKRKDGPRPQAPAGLNLLPFPDTQTDPSQETKKAIREILSWVAVFVGAVGLAALIQFFVLEPLRVDGHSMNDTLLNNEFVLVSKADYWGGDPERLDVVICRYPNREDTYVKRVVGLPGDTVQVHENTVLVNGVALNEPYITYPADYDYGPLTLSADEYFVLDDNRIHSTDSHIIGPIKRDAILGRVRLVIYPLDKIRTIPAGVSPGTE